MKLRYKIGLVIAVLGAVFIWGHCSRQMTPASSNNAPLVLPKNETERITVDSEKHTLTIQTPTSIKTVTLPDKKSVIDVLKNGEVKVASPQFGLEHHVFVGFSMSDNLRLTMGLDGLYYKKLDLGLGIGTQTGNHNPIVFAKLSYNIYGNIQAGIMYGSNQSIGAIITVRLF